MRPPCLFLHDGSKVLQHSLRVAQGYIRDRLSVRPFWLQGGHRQVSQPWLRRTARACLTSRTSAGWRRRSPQFTARTLRPRRGLGWYRAVCFDADDLAGGFLLARDLVQGKLEVHHRANNRKQPVEAEADWLAPIVVLM